MKGFSKLMNRVIGRSLLLMLLMLVTGILTYLILLLYIVHKDGWGSHPTMILKAIERKLVKENDNFRLAPPIQSILKEKEVWVMLIDNESGNVKWSLFLPDSIPLHYNLSDVAVMSKSYLKNYPVFIRKNPEGLLVIGFPVGSYGKFSTYFPTFLIRNFSWYVFWSYIIQLLTVLVLFFLIEKRMFRSLRPILKSIQQVADGKEVHLPEKGTFSEVAVYLNRTSALLKKRATVRENWLAGISHDIRTPLAAILGYSGQIAEDESLPLPVTQKAAIIRNQAVHLRELILSVTLSSRLERDDFLTQSEKFNMTRFCREIMADFLNNYADERYPVEIKIGTDIQELMIEGNPHLLQRGITNLLFNSIRHNPEGCDITLQLEQKTEYCILTISDNGQSMEASLLQKLESICNGKTDSIMLSGREHGLGLYIVCQIVKMHGGTIAFTAARPKGFVSTIRLPLTGIKPAL